MSPKSIKEYTVLFVTRYKRANYNQKKKSWMNTVKSQDIIESMPLETKVLSCLGLNYSETNSEPGLYVAGLA